MIMIWYFLKIYNCLIKLIKQPVHLPIGQVNSICSITQDGLDARYTILYIPIYSVGGDKSLTPNTVRYPLGHFN